MAKLAPFVLFLGLCYAFAPAIVSLVKRISSAWKKSRGCSLPDAAKWAASVACGLALAFGMRYVFQTYGVELVPPPGIAGIVGLLVGLGASGLVDLAKYMPVRT